MSSQHATDDAVAFAASTLQNLLDRMDVEASVEVDRTDERRVLLQVRSPQASQLIGRRGETLDALDLVLSRMVRHAFHHAPAFVVDVEGHREQHVQQLQEQAAEALRSVRESGRTYRFGLLCTQDRRILHRALANELDVRTQSVDLDRADGFKEMELLPQSLPGDPSEMLAGEG